MDAQTAYYLRALCKTVIPALAVPLVFVFYWIDHGHWRRFRVIANVLLGLLAGFSALAYFEFGYLRYGRFINPHDVFHYYIGAKYSREVDYVDVYRCALIADMEMRKVYKQARIRNLDTHGYEPVKPILQNANRYKASFTPVRWKEFKKDIAYFISIMPAYKWQQVLCDKGYNATPVWNTVARFLANRVATDNWLGMNALILIDEALLIGMFAAVWWAFGWRVALFAIIYFGSNFMHTFVHIKGAFLRMDWVACLVVATCLLKKSYYKTAGALMAYSAMARVFPAIFLFGIGIKLMFRCLNYALAFVRTRKLTWPEREDWQYVAFFVAFAIACGVFVGISTLDDGGLQRWESFSKKIAIHNKDISTTRVGFKYIFLSPYKQFGEKGIAFEQHKRLWWALMAVLLTLAVFPVRKLDDYETVPYGFVPAFFLTAPTFYYYIMLIVPLFLFVPKLARLPRAAGLAGMFTISFASFVMFEGMHVPLEFKLCFILSCALQALVVYMMAASFWTREAVAVEAVPMPEPEPAPTPATPPAAESPRTRKSKKKSRSKSGPAPMPRAATLPEAQREPPAPGGATRTATAASLLWIVPAALVLLVAVLLFVGFRSHRAAQPAAPAAEGPEAQLVFVGDVMLSRNVAASIAKHNQDYTFPFQRTMAYTRAADLAFCNLECPVTERHPEVQKNYVFQAAPQAMDGVAAAGFRIVSVANNHVLDCGPEGLQDTLAALAKSHLTYVGLCTNDEPQLPLAFGVRGIKIGYLAYADPRPQYAYAKEFLQFPTRPAKGEKPTIQADIARLKPQVDVVVVSMHWGVEYQTQSDAWQQELGHFIIDAGANIVAGHHPHVQQEPELYNGGLIIYSMGNFVFDQHTRPPTRLSRLYRVFVNKNGFVRADYLPLEITNQDWQPTPTAQQFLPVSNGAALSADDNG